MRTKTLLIATAAALAAGIISSQAQVYSQNIVGYVNLNVTNGTLAILAPTLDADGTGTNNTISSTFGTNVTVGDVVFVFNGTGYDTLNFAHPRSQPLGWYLNGTLDNTYPLNPGIGAFYQPAATETITIVGTALTGTNVVNRYVAPANGISLVSSVVPVGGSLTTNLQYSATIGDVIFEYNGTGYDTYNYAHPRSQPQGWYLNGTLTDPQINVGQGFWLQPAATTTWSQNIVPQ
jgi:hypothetical protein